MSNCPNSIIPLLNIYILINQYVFISAVSLVCSPAIACPGEPVVCRCVVQVDNTMSGALVWMVNNSTKRHFSHDSNVNDTMPITERAVGILVSINSSHITSDLRIAPALSGDVVVCEKGFRNEASTPVTLTVAGESIGNMFFCSLSSIKYSHEFTVIPPCIHRTTGRID